MADAPSEGFLDWWFAPWRYAGDAAPPLAPAASDLLGRRDAYRDWCRAAGVPAQFGVGSDWRWQAAALEDGELLSLAGELFGGLLAARGRRDEALAALPPARRRWCLSVALTQPLTSWCGEPASASTLAQRGLLELAARLEQAFPGMWSRLRLLLPAIERQLLRLPDLAPGNLHERDRRCWLMCVTQARAELAIAGATSRTESP